MWLKQAHSWEKLGWNCLEHTSQHISSLWENTHFHCSWIILTWRVHDDYLIVFIPVVLNLLALPTRWLVQGWSMSLICCKGGAWGYPVGLIWLESDPICQLQYCLAGPHHPAREVLHGSGKLAVEEQQLMLLLPSDKSYHGFWTCRETCRLHDLAIGWIWPMSWRLTTAILDRFSLDSLQW